MIKKNSFYIALIIIYLLYLTKDNLFSFVYKEDNLNQYTCRIENENKEQEYQDLLKSLNLKETYINMTYSKVLLRDIYEFYDYITLDIGTNQSVKKGDIVINEYGLVGIITKVNKNTSKVQLITNKDTNISVKINNSYGILYGENGKLYVKNIKIEGEIKEGEEVVTSGLTSIPEGIKIGSVKEINKDNLEIEYVLDIDNKSLQSIPIVGVIHLWFIYF